MNAFAPYWGMPRSVADIFSSLARQAEARKKDVKGNKEGLSAAQRKARDAEVTDP